MEEIKRETKTIKTPVGKHEVILKSWLTGRERRRLSKFFKKESKISFSSGIKRIKESEAKIDLNFSGELADEIADKAISVIVVSVDGVKEKVLETILGMHEEDFDFIAAEVTKVSQGKVFTKPESKAGDSTD